MRNLQQERFGAPALRGSGQVGATLGLVSKREGRYKKKRAPRWLGALLPEDSLSGNPPCVKKNGGLPFGADAVFEDGGAVFVDGDFELGGPGGGLGEFVGGGEHFPIAADGLVDLDGDGRVFVVAQGDLELHFPDVGVDAFVIGLFALGDYVEGVADVDGDGFVFGRVVDVVFADEKDAALGILLIDAEVAGGQRHT